MELTKKDQKQIERDVDAVISHIRVAATEYAHLYEQTFYDALMERIRIKKEVNETYKQYELNRKIGKED